MAQLAGKFAGIVEVAVDDARGVARRRARRTGRPKVTVETAVAKVGWRGTPAAGWKLALVGHDRIGIVREKVSQVLARHAVNVSKDLHGRARRCRFAVLFHAEAELTAAPGSTRASLTEARWNASPTT